MVRKKLRYGFFMVLALGTLIVVWRVRAQEKTLSRADWAPDKGVATFFDKKRVEIELTWSKKVPPAQNNSLEIEVVVPAWERGSLDRTRVFNHLNKTVASRLPASCQYKDIAFWDPCENWAQGLLLNPGCLESVTPGTLKILMDTDEVPSSVTSARLLVSRSEKGGLADRMRVAGGAGGCTALCAACQGGPAPVNWVCPSIFGRWLADLCGQCDRAWDETTPEWNFFSASSTWCAEPVPIPGVAEFLGCGKPPFGVQCKDPIHEDAPVKMCVPTTKECTSPTTSRTCASTGLEWQEASCRCGCANGACRQSCMPGMRTCVPPGTVVKECAPDGCSSKPVESCACGCSRDQTSCQPLTCTPGSKSCRDAATLIKCADNGCSSTTVSCGYGCRDGECQGPTSVPDMALPSTDMASMPIGEICNGLDDDGNGKVDDFDACWTTIYRFVSPTSSYCFGLSPTAPVACSGYAYQRPVFAVPRFSLPNTVRVVQCSQGNDHVLVSYGSGEYASLIGGGYDCSLTLGYFPNPGTGPRTTPYGNPCMLYRFRYTNILGQTVHISTLGDDGTTGITCEPPNTFQAYAPSGGTCFSMKPGGC